MLVDTISEWVDVQNSDFISDCSKKAITIAVAFDSFVDAAKNFSEGHAGVPECCANDIGMAKLQAFLSKQAAFVDLKDHIESLSASEEKTYDKMVELLDKAKTFEVDEAYTAADDLVKAIAALGGDHVSSDPKTRWTSKMKPNWTMEKIAKQAKSTVLKIDGDSLEEKKVELGKLINKAASIAKTLGIPLKDDKIKEYQTVFDAVSLCSSEVEFILGVEQCGEDGVKALNFASMVEKWTYTSKFHQSILNHIEKMKRMEM